MRIIVPHNQPKEEVVRAVDQAITDLFQKSIGIPIQFVQQQRSWQGSKLTFSMIAKMGLLRTPIKGIVEVTDRDVLIDVDLGMLERLIPADKARDMLGSRIKGLLK
jgi:hypothetical protein